MPKNLQIIIVFRHIYIISNLEILNTANGPIYFFLTLVEFFNMVAPKNLSVVHERNSFGIISLIFVGIKFCRTRLPHSLFRFVSRIPVFLYLHFTVLRSPHPRPSPFSFRPTEATLR